MSELLVRWKRREELEGYKLYHKYTISKPLLTLEFRRKFEEGILKEIRDKLFEIVRMYSKGIILTNLVKKIDPDDFRPILELFFYTDFDENKYLIIKNEIYNKLFEIYERYSIRYPLMQEILEDIMERLHIDLLPRSFFNEAIRVSEISPNSS